VEGHEAQRRAARAARIAQRIGCGARSSFCFAKGYEDGLAAL
jgi:hypothetical protein